MEKLLLAMLVMTGFAHAQPVKFGFFDTPQERADKFRSGFSVGEVITGKLEVGSRTIRLPAGDWKVAGVNSYVGTIKDIYSDDVKENNPHGEIFLFQEADGMVQKVFVMTMPIGSTPNRSWTKSVPDVCKPDWSNDSKYWQVARNLDAARLDCSIVRFGRVFSWKSPINDAAKYGFKKLGINYDDGLYYLVGQVYISVNAATYFVSYAEYFSDENDNRWLMKDNINDANRKKVGEMIDRVEGFRIRLKEDI